MKSIAFAFFSVLLASLADAHPLIVSQGDMGSYIVSIDVDFDGQPRRFQFDTGANSSMVEPDEITAEYAVVGQRQSRGAAGTTIECAEIEAEKIGIGPLVLPKQKFARCDLGTESMNNLGLGHFEGMILDLRFSDSELEFLAAIPEKNPSFKLERLSLGHLKIPIRLGVDDFSALFDTGAQLSAVDSEFVKTNPNRFKPLASEEVVRNITGAVVESEYFILDQVEIGGIVFNDVTVIAFDFGEIRNYFGIETPLIVGTNIIVHADWTFDLISNQWNVRESQP